MPPIGTEEKNQKTTLNISSHSTGLHGLEGRTGGKNLAPDQFFSFLLLLSFLKGPYEIALGTVVCPFSKACQENH